jgi:iron-sulfur cluster assembly protein
MITITKPALEKLKRFRAEEGKEGFALRIAVVGGGCSGLQYKLSFDEKSSPEDKVISFKDLQLYIDPKSWPYLKGLKLDYDGSLNGAGFKYENPNAAKACGCGTSFNIL